MKLTARQRKKIPKSQLGIPSVRGKGPSGMNKAARGGYPMPDKEHAINAKSRATQAFSEGRMSRAEYDRIIAKANRKIKASK